MRKTQEPIPEARQNVETPEQESHDNSLKAGSAKTCSVRAHIARHALPKEENV
jgi:hypothetical protein